MSRVFCYQCGRARVACLCGRIAPQANEVAVTVLQHPHEAKNPKGSAIIAELGLQQYVCWRGEDFTQHEGLLELIAGGETAVLFPGESAEPLQSAARDRSRKVSSLLIIDASWRKARKIWQLNPQLHQLPQITFAAGYASDYRIRKVPQQGYLSTIESIVEALRILESRPQGYQALLDLFAEMIDFQIAQMGEDTYRRHYKDHQENNLVKNEKKDSK